MLWGSHIYENLGEPDNEKGNALFLKNTYDCIWFKKYIIIELQ